MLVLVLSGPFWPILAHSGPFWPILVNYSPIGIILSRCRCRHDPTCSWPAMFAVTSDRVVEGWPIINPPPPGRARPGPGMRGLWLPRLATPRNNRAIGKNNLEKYGTSENVENGPEPTPVAQNGPTRPGIATYPQFASTQLHPSPLRPIRQLPRPHFTRPDFRKFRPNPDFSSEGDLDT